MFCDGSEFIGEIVNDEINGQGTLKFSNGEIYSGFWSHNSKGG